MGCRGVSATVALALSGCASYGSHLGASTLPAGEDEVSLNADVLVIDRGLGHQVLPAPEIGYRFGVASDLDLGGRLNAGSVELNARWRVIQSTFADLALVPAAELVVDVIARGVVGARLPLGRRWYVFPELNVLMPYDTRRGEWHLPTLQGGVAFQFE